jgi:hypothetical protein
MHRVTNKTIFNIFKSLLKEDHVNYDHAIKAIISLLDSDSLEYIVDMLSDDKPLQLINRGDYIKTEIDSYHAKTYFNYDTLKEMGLICPDTDMVYAIVTEDGSYSSKYNPYYGTVRVKFLYHDDEGKLSYHEHKVHTLSVTKVDKSDIKYFTSLNNGKNKQTSTQIGDKEVGNLEEALSKTSS